MAEYSPTWDEICAAFCTVLGDIAGVKHATDRHPERAIGRSDFVWVTVSEPTFAPSAFTFGAVTITYKGNLDVFVLAVKTDQERLNLADSSICRNMGLNIHTYIHANRNLAVAGKKASVSLGEAKIAKLSSTDADNRGDYGGLVIPYTVSIQYASV